MICTLDVRSLLACLFLFASETSRDGSGLVGQFGVCVAFVVLLQQQ